MSTYVMHGLIGESANKLCWLEGDMTVMAVIWMVWCERNARNFSNKFRHSLDMVNFINSYVVFWLGNLSSKNWTKSADQQGYKGLAGRWVMRNRTIAARMEEDDNWAESGAEDGEVGMKATIFMLQVWILLKAAILQLFV